MTTEQALRRAICERHDDDFVRLHRLGTPRGRAARVDAWSNTIMSGVEAIGFLSFVGLTVYLTIGWAFTMAFYDGIGDPTETVARMVFWPPLIARALSRQFWKDWNEL